MIPCFCSRIVLAHFALSWDFNVFRFILFSERFCSVSFLTMSIYSGGRGVVVGPIVSQTLSDVFCDNEYGSNFLFKNNGDGTFTDMAQQAGKGRWSLGGCSFVYS